MNEYENNLNPSDVDTEQLISEEPVVPVVEEVPQEPAAPAKKGFQLNKKLLIPVVAAVAVVLVIVIVASSLLNSPLALVGRGIKNSLDALQKNEVVSLATDIAEGGSVEFLCSLDELAYDMPVEADASLKVYTALPDRSAVVANLIVDEEPLLDASVLVDEKSIAFGSEALLGDEYYGVSMDGIAERFSDSVFGYDGAYSLDIELPEGFDALMEDAQKITKESKEITELIAGTALKSLKKHAEISKDRETLEFADKKVKVTAVEVQLDAKALANMAADMIEFIRDNKKVKAYLESNAEYATTLMEAFGMDGYYDSAEDMIDEMYDALDELELDKAAIKDLERSIKASGFDMTVVFQITNSGKELVGVKFSGKIDGEKVKLTVQAGPSWKDLNEVNFRYEDDYSIYRGAYVVETNNRTEFEADLKIREDNEVVYSGKINHDKKDGDFEIELTDSWGDVYGAEGTLEKTSKATTIVLDAVYGEGEELELGVTAVLSRSDKMPSMPKFTDVLDLDEYDIEAMAEDLEDTASTLALLLRGF